MEWMFVIIVLISVMAGTGFYILRAGADSERLGGKATLDPEQMRRDMLNDAKSEEEYAYLQELSELDLHRKHLIC